MTQRQITKGFDKGNAPSDRTTRDSENMLLLEVNANFDGSGAGTDYLPAVVVISDSGEVVARMVADTAVAAGDDAEVTFAPFLRNTRGFIRFLVQNVGGWLDIETTGGSSTSEGYGFRLVTTNGIKMDSGGAGTDIYTSGGGYNIDTSQPGGGGGGYVATTDGGGVLWDTGGGGYEVKSRDGGIWITPRDGGLDLGEASDISLAGSTRELRIQPLKLGFFAVAPISQPAHPVTLNDVINALTALGLTA